MSDVVSRVCVVLATGVDLLHVLAMLIWGVGLPLLFWHRWPRLSRAYMRFTILFVGISVGSHWLFDECVLTSLARELWVVSAHQRSSAPFTMLLANAVAGIRPSRDEAVLAWELAMFGSSVAGLWSWHRTRLVRSRREGLSEGGGAGATS